MFAAGDDLLKRMTAVSAEDVLFPLLVQLTVILLAARAFGLLFKRFGQPTVVGEIAAGLVLGPSVLGALFPSAFALLFRPDFPGLSPADADPLVGRVLMTISQVGLVLLLFLVGLEFEFDHLAVHGTSALAISVAGVVVPFGLGCALGAWMHPLVAADLPWLGFVLFMGVSMCITAIPTLGRIMLEMGITKTPLATITITAAAVGDAAGWILLAAVAALTRAEFDGLKTVSMIVATLAFALFMVWLARPLLCRLTRAMVAAGKGDLGVNSLAVILALLFVCSAVTNRIGIFAIFGAFLFGAVLSGEAEVREAIGRKLRDFVTAFFLPIFFAYTGLRTNIGTLTGVDLWALAGLVTLVAVAGKFGGCSVAAWLSGMRPREAACVGALMNTRGLVELIVINVGMDLGVIPPSVYCMLVLMALLTTFLTTPMLLAAMPGTQLEPLIRESGFLGEGQGEGGQTCLDDCRSTV
jgi:Kef-type K+ transport system membrane component KefB